MQNSEILQLDSAGEGTLIGNFYSKELLMKNVGLLHALRLLEICCPGRALLSCLLKDAHYLLKVRIDSNLQTALFLNSRVTQRQQ